LKNTISKWWRKLVGCFRDLSGTIRNRRNRSRKDFKNPSRTPAVRTEERPVEDKKRHGNHSSAAKRTRKNFMQK
jgi:hypothetical protein